jgi:hypothetical protein
MRTMGLAAAARWRSAQADKLIELLEAATGRERGA